jgi:DNA-directed RNA polymerase specialized sigma24 family protein
VSYRDDGPLAAWVWKIALRVALESRRRPHALPREEAVDPALLEPGATRSWRRRFAGSRPADA